MANWCQNTVVFNGDHVVLENIRQIFRDLAAQMEKTQLQLFPEFITKQSGFVLDIKVSSQKICFQTKWGPDLVLLKQIADYYDVGFTDKYHQLETGVYGEATYKSGTLNNIRLTPGELAANYGRTTDRYRHAGKNDAYEFDRVDKILENRKTAINRKNNSGLSRSLRYADLFKTESNISQESLTALYGQLTSFQLAMKFAEHKNFVKAKEVFDGWDEQTVFKTDNHIGYSFVDLEELYPSKEKFLAIKFLSNLLQIWNGLRKEIETGRKEQTGIDPGAEPQKKRYAGR